MRKIYKAALAMMIGVSAMAQTPFFTPTSYRGAFAPAPTNMWTDTWTEWDPQNKVYSTPTNTVSTDITVNTTWSSSNIYLIQGLIYVRNGATLTIQPGTTIMGDKGVANSSLVITKGAKINAAGTASQPIVFTSNQAAGSRNPGDWGGVILLGKGTLNQPGDTASVEGIAPTLNTQYGGGGSPDDNDNSGVMQYVRIEFGGYIFASNKEINGLTLGAVGAGTTLDHIQVSFANDDGFEWFGGAVNAKYLVSYRNLDDDFDTDFGFSGHIQFGLSVRDPNIADNPSVSTSEGFESDNDAGGSSLTPFTSAVFSNMTMIGPYRGSTANVIATGYRRGARLRRNTRLKIFNSIFMDHPRGIHIDAAACEANATAGTLKFRNNLVAGNATGRVTEVNTGSTFNAPAWFAANMNDSLVSTAGILTTPYNFTAPDYRPATGSLALSNSDFTNTTFCGWVINSITPTISGSTAFCAGSNTVLSAPALGAGYSYQWSANAGSATTQTVSVNTAGTFTLTITDPYCNQFTNTVTTTINALPTINISGSNTICIGSNTTLTASGATSYAWNTGASTNTVTVSPATATSYTVTGTDANGCVNTQNVTVNVNLLPTVSISGTTTICTGSNTALTASGASTYSWNTGSTNNPLIVSPTSATSYTVTGTASNGCVNTQTVSVAVNSLPSISISGSTVVCSGQSTTLTATGAVGYLWNTGFPSAALTVSPTSATSYTVTGTDGNGCTNVATTNVSVNTLPVLATTPSITNASCGNADGAIANVTVTGNGTLTYAWMDAANNTVGTAATISSIAAGVYNLMVTDGNNCSDVFGPYSIVNPGAPAIPAVLISDSTVCEGSNITLTASTPGTSVTYQWSGAGGFSSTNQNTSINGVTAANNGVITVTATESNCTSGAAIINLTVYSLPSVGLGAASSSICAAASAVTLTGSPAGGTYSGTGVSGGSFFASIAGVGTYTLTYNYTDANGCSNNATTAITVNAMPSVSSSATASSVCVNSTTNALTGSPAGGTFSGTGVSGTNFNASLAGAGTYTVTYNYTDANGCSGSSTSAITVNALPSVAVVPADNSVCQQDAAVNLTGVPSGGTYSGTGVSGSSFNPAVAGAGTFTVTYTYTDANSCTNSSTTTIAVSACVGVEEAVKEFGSANLYPNPADNAVNIYLSEMNDEVSFTVFNSTGQLVEQFKAADKLTDSNTVKINTTDYSNGLYFVNIVDNGSKKMIRFIISK